MSAPVSAYSAKLLPVHIYGTAKFDNLLGLKLTEYGNDILNLFYLSQLLIVKNGTEELFIGLIDADPNTLTGKMHPLVKYGKLRLKNSANGKTYVALNDAGLNTFGLSDQPIATANFTIELYEINPVQFKSAYYSASTIYGIILKGRGTRADKKVEFSNLAAKGIDYRTFGNPFNGYEEAPQAGTTIELISYITNDQGTYTTASSYALVKPYLKAVGYSQQYASYAVTAYNSHQYTNLYFSRYPINVQYADGRGLCGVYTDVSLFNRPNETSGFFTDGNFWYGFTTNAQNVRVVTDMGAIGFYNQSDPAYVAPNPGYYMYNFVGKGNSKLAACQSNGLSIDSYQRNSDGLYFTDSNFTTFTSDGYYKQLISNGQQGRIIWILNGEQQQLNDQFCN